MFVRCIWLALRGYTIDDINRLKEGAVQQVEGKGQVALAEVRVKVAEAAERQAKANKVNAEARAIRMKSDSDYAKEISKACVEFADAVNRIKRQGGNVAFYEEQMRTLLLRGAQEFPEDPTLQLPQDETES